MRGSGTAYAVWGVGAVFSLIVAIATAFIRYAWNDIRNRVGDCAANIKEIRDTAASKQDMKDVGTDMKTLSGEVNGLNRRLTRQEAHYDLHMWTAHNLHPKDIGDRDQGDER